MWGSVKGLFWVCLGVRVELFWLFLVGGRVPLGRDGVSSRLEIGRLGLHLAAVCFWAACTLDGLVSGGLCIASCVLETTKHRILRGRGRD